ncbi:hypothetical protein KEM52_003181 [Ascosphaera acerosa]|nr:hypothetical protein KEM52_003181 [Ascosphaera acerosa]
MAATGGGDRDRDQDQDQDQDQEEHAVQTSTGAADKAATANGGDDGREKEKGGKKSEGEEQRPAAGPGPGATITITTTITTPEEPPRTSKVTDLQWRCMTDVVMAIYAHREPDGYDPSRLFQKNVNKRNVPDYYDIIKEPMALSILKAKIKGRVYMEFSEFVRDCALIPHNAQTYNRPRSQAYEDSLIVKAIFEDEFRHLADEGIISPAEAELPDLGEIPDPDPLPEEEEEEEADGDAEGDEHGEDDEVSPAI